MGLFPEGSSSGMGGFGGGNSSPKKEEVKKEEIPVQAQEDLKKVEIKTEEIPKKQEQEKQEKIEPVRIQIQDKTEDKKEVKQEEIKKEEDVEDSKEKILSKKEEVPVKKTEEKKEPVPEKSEKDESSSDMNTEDDFSQFTSVRIAGLTAPDDLEVTSHFQLEGADFASSEAGEGGLLGTDNLSTEEREALGDMSDYYFQSFSSSESIEGGITLDELLDLCIDKDASDIHFAAGEKIGLRVNGKILFINNIPELTVKQARQLVFALVPNPLHRKRLFDNRELDCAFEHVVRGVNFRVNIFFKQGNMAAVLRRIASHAMTMEQLGLPKAIKELLKQKQGLLLVTGPTGSGKSTSMQSMLEFVNESRVEHILTIEDPIEYIFTNKKSIFSQREVGRDTNSFSNALRASLREDPDVVMIGEMRDAETIQAAMNLSETGHFVVSTLHTSSAPQTIARIISYFPSDEQEQVQSRLADTLIGVLSQRLIPRADREGRVAIFELMIVNSAIRNIIRTGDMTQIHNAMLAGREGGMVRMEDYANELADQGIVHSDNFESFFREE